MIFKKEKRLTMLEVGDIVRFIGEQTKWTVEQVNHGGTMVHLELVSGEGPAYSIPARSLEIVEKAKKDGGSK
jgi:hypothetical protein